MRYKTETYYLYLPHGKQQERIIYLAAGIIIPVLIGQAVKAIKKKLKNAAGKAREKKEKTAGQTP